MNTTIKCGNCQSIHSSVEEVKACYNVQPLPERTEDDLLPCERKAIETGKVSAKAFTIAAITPKQESFLNSLLAERPAYRDVNNFHPEVVARMSKLEASDQIAAALKEPKELPQPKQVPAIANETETVKEAGVVEGYYAIEIDGTVKFYRIDMPTEGKWAGRTFISVQASSDFHAVRNAESRKAIIFAIVSQGVQNCQRQYGLLLGRCGACNRPLTDETSRAYGIGPVCREKYGFGA